MTTFIKTKFKKSDDQTSIDRITYYSKIHEYKTIISCKNIKNQHV